MFSMRSLSFLTTLVFTLSLAHQALASSHGALKRRHPSTLNTVERRAQFDNARMTFYKTGQGACGGFNNDNDFIVALNVPQYGSGGHCGETITITYNGKSTQATVADECMECPFGAIDLSPGLFSFLNNGNMDAGTIYGGWGFGAGEAPKPTTTSTPPPPPPTTTTSHTPKTTSTPPPPPPTTTSKARPSTTSTSSTESSSPPPTSSSSSSVAPSSTSSTPTASATPTPTLEQGTLNSLNQAFIGVAGLALLTFPQN